MSNLNTYKTMIADEFTRRKERNPNYSLRSFAKSLDLSPSILSELLNGKRDLSKRSAVKICDAICGTPETRQTFLTSLSGVNLHPNQPEKDMDLDQFFMMSEWYHMAILSLARVTPNSSSRHWIAKRLNINVREADAAFNRLLRLNLIREEDRGFSRTCEPISVNPTMPVTAVQKYHREILQNAAEAVTRVPRELRDISSVTMPTSPEMIERARPLIKKFRYDLSELLESAPPKEVYTLCVQLFPVTTQEGS